MHRILVTGAAGFVGRALCHELTARGSIVRAAVRKEEGEKRLPIECEVAVVGEISAATDWLAAVESVDVVVHLAARVHVMRETAGDPLASFREVNVLGTECLACAAASSGVKRLVYVSSIKVNGEQTNGISFSEVDEPSPQDPYGVSKYEAEQVLHNIAKETGLEVVIVRPPLVYGPRVGGNFLRLLKLVSHGMPLPLASVNNRRSMIFLGNFVDALLLCATHPAASGKTYLVSDDEDQSTPQLIRKLASLMGKPCRLIPFPLSLLKWVGSLTGKSSEVERLIGSLQIDSNLMRRELGWVAPFSMDNGLAETVKWFQENKK